MSKDNVYCGLFAYLLVCLSVSLIFIWPRELSLIFNSVLILAILLFIFNCWSIGYLFYRRGGSSRNVRFCCGILLIFSACLMQVEIEEIRKNIEFWEPLFSGAYSSLFIIIKLIIPLGNNIINIGIVAFGTSLATKAITEK